jgi:hypothetical protein
MTVVHLAVAAGLGVACAGAAAAQDAPATATQPPVLVPSLRFDPAPLTRGQRTTLIATVVEEAGDGDTLRFEPFEGVTARFVRREPVPGGVTLTFSVNVSPRALPGARTITLRHRDGDVYIGEARVNTHLIRIADPAPSHTDGLTSGATFTLEDEERDVDIGPGGEGAPVVRVTGTCGRTATSAVERISLMRPAIQVKETSPTTSVVAVGLSQLTGRCLLELTVKDRAGNESNPVGIEIDFGG